jgi:hypothetical protein
MNSRVDVRSLMVCRGTTGGGIESGLTVYDGNDVVPAWLVGGCGPQRGPSERSRPQAVSSSQLLDAAPPDRGLFGTTMQLPDSATSLPELMPKAFTGPSEVKGEHGASANRVSIAATSQNAALLSFPCLAS